MVGAVRTRILWVPAGPWLPRCDLGHLRHRQGASSQRCWVLDAGLAAAFDRIDYLHLLSQLGSFPARKDVGAESGVVEKGRLAPTEEGTPQGGLCGAAHNPPNEQCQVMRSVGLSGLVRAGAGAERCA